MKISASQLETADLCLRKWRFQYQDRMPVYKKAHFGFGTCLHGCAERHLRGEKNLYPEGWDIDPDSKQRLEPEDARLIPVLIQAGIDSGYLEARRDSRIESSFSMEVGDHTLVGKIDHLSVLDRLVEDHKTARTDAYIKKTGKALSKNLQMQIYAKVLLEEIRSRGEVDPRIVTLAHNQFITNKKTAKQPEVRRTSGEVTSDEIEVYWIGTVLPLIERMDRAAAAAGTLEIPMAEAKSCNAFGGCPFMPLCSGQEDVLTYRARVSSLISSQVSVPVTQQKDPKPMSSLSDFLNKRAQGATQTPSVNPPAPAAAAAPAPAPAKAAVPTSTPPWWSSKCPACSPVGKNRATPGFDEKKAPCRICKSLSAVKPDDYEWEAKADGSVEWWKKGSRQQTVATTAPAEVTDKGEKTHYTVDSFLQELIATKTPEAAVGLLEKAQEALGDSPELDAFTRAVDKHLEQMAEPAPAPAPTPAPEPATPVQPPAQPTEAPKQRGPGRPRKEKVAEPAPAPSANEPAGFALCVGCAPIGQQQFPGMVTRSAEEVLAKLPDYWAKDAFARRDEVRRIAAVEWQAGLAGIVVVATIRNPDVDNLISTLRPLATLVIAGTW